jgi:hypothetical protein
MVPTDLLRTAVLLHVSHAAAVNIQYGAHSYSTVQEHHDILAIKNVAQHRNYVRDQSEINVNEHQGVHNEVVGA